MLLEGGEVWPVVLALDYPLHQVLVHGGGAGGGAAVIAVGIAIG